MGKKLEKINDKRLLLMFFRFLTEFLYQKPQQMINCSLLMLTINRQLNH